MTHDLQFGGAYFRIIGDAALYWPEHRALLVADLHLEKASSYAMEGQMLPPYDSLDTLSRLASLAEKVDATSVICLGDNFHDDGGEARLSDDAAEILRAMTSEYRWIWIAGNHDPEVEALAGGEACEELEMGGIMLRHQAVPDWQDAEISGHFHPKLRLNINRRHVARRCFVSSSVGSASKLILPAFGALTGGMDAGEAALIAQPHLSHQGAAEALVALEPKLVRFPLDTRDSKPSTSTPLAAAH